ncbi:G protein alpha subunit tga3 [Ancistrocladus abbreviatus]
MGIFEPPQQIIMWRDPSNGISASVPGSSSILQVDAQSDISRQSLGPLDYDQEASRLADKIRRRLEQNREAARKSRLRKKAYVQQLENSRLKLAQLEQDLDQAKQQGLYIGSAYNNYGIAGNMNTGIAAFEMEYGHWLEEQHRQNCELRNALQANISDVELGILVDGCLSHYYNLFRMKADATKADVFYLMSGIWRTSAERVFLWIGGFRPSELLNVVMPQLEPLTDQQAVEIGKLRHSSQQAEEALSRGLDKLQQTLAQIVWADGLGGEIFNSQIASAIEKLEALEGFVNQADNLREHALQLMSRILTPSQAARGFLALGEYLHRLRALGTLWAARPRDHASEFYAVRENVF